MVLFFPRMQTKVMPAILDTLCDRQLWMLCVLKCEERELLITTSLIQTPRLEQRELLHLPPSQPQ